MTVLVGHPTGNPISYNAATAYLEAGLLECFCVSWMPSTRTLNLLSSIRRLQRLGRRQFPPPSRVPKMQGRVREVCRLLIRELGLSSDYQGNRWLMRTMARECHRSRVTAVHAYEDCSLWQFMEAKRLGKACVYDMPTCYYAARDKTQSELLRKYPDWLPPNWSPAVHDMPAEQKRQEMTLADLTLVPSLHVEATIREYYPDKDIARAPYG